MTIRTLTCLVMLAGAVNAQAPIAFEIAWIKPAAPLVGSSRYQVNDIGVDITDVSLMDLLITAYRVKRFQISGPSGLNEQHYDLTGKFASGGTPQQLPEMFQSLLAEQLGLRVHHESRDFSGYALTTVKGGFKPLTDDDMKVVLTNPLMRRAKSTGNFSPAGGPQKLAGYQIGVVSLIGTLSRILSSPVENQTGITGDMNYILEAEPVFAADSHGPLLVASLARMGLMLEPKKIPMDVIVIDHIEKTPIVD